MESVNMRVKWYEEKKKVKNEMNLLREERQEKNTGKRIKEKQIGWWKGKKRENIIKERKEIDFI